MNLSLVNKTTSLPGPTVLSAIASAIQVQAAQHFAPAWGLAPSTIDVGGTGFPIVLLDTPDQANALGYHDRDPHGNPYARVFAGPVLSNGGDWASKPLSVASVISHEVLELLADPAANRWVQGTAAAEYALEVCDPCESVSYSINGVTVSDFVLPSWFDPGAKGPYTYRSSISRPLGIGKGGYVIVARLSSETQKFGRELEVSPEEAPPEWRLATKVGVSRTARRLALPV